MSNTPFECKLFDVLDQKQVKDIVDRSADIDGPPYFDEAAFLPAIPRVGEMVVFSGRSWRVREVIYTHRDQTALLYVREEGRGTPYRG